MKISLKSILLPLEVLPYHHFFGNFPEESSCLHTRVSEGQRQRPPCDWNWEHLSVQQHWLPEPQLCCQSLSVLALKPRAGSVAWEQHYSIWEAPLYYLLQMNTDSKQRSKDTSISPAELLDRADFTDATLFAIRKSYQLQKIPTEVIEQAFLAIRVFLAVMLLFGFLLTACL